MSNLQIPKELNFCKSLIELTAQPYVKIKAQKGETTLFQSKFSGNPYMPLTEKYPYDTYGKPMKLLAQINFEEVPHLEHMPKQGLLQIFISQEDDVHGCSFGEIHNQDDYKIIFHQNVITDESLLMQDFSFVQEDIEDNNFPMEAEDVQLTFKLDYAPLSPNDYKFDAVFKDVLHWELNEEAYNLYCERFGGEGHKIGGYPYFTQFDPRENDIEYDILLLQIDTDGTIDCMWGDSGIANFFIKKNDLLNLDFSKVLYNWDCC